MLQFTFKILKGKNHCFSEDRKMNWKIKRGRKRSRGSEKRRGQVYLTSFSTKNFIYKEEKENSYKEMKKTKTE